MPNYEVVKDDKYQYLVIYEGESPRIRMYTRKTGRFIKEITEF